MCDAVQQIPSGQGYILKQQQKALLYSKQKEGQKETCYRLCICVE